MGEDAWNKTDEARYQRTPLLPVKGNDLPLPRGSTFLQPGE